MGARVNRAADLIVAIVLGVLGALAAAGPASAHNSLTGSDPANGARIAVAPAVVRLTFLSRLDPQRTELTVVGPDNVPAAGGPPTFAANKVTIPFRPGRAGLYTVSYRVGSADGHPVTGEVRFTLTTGTAAVPPTTAPPAGTGTPGAAAATSGAGTSAGSPAVTPTPDTTPAAATRPARWPWLAGGILLLGALVTAALLLARRRR